MAETSHILSAGSSVEKHLREKLKWLMFFRISVALVLLVTGTLVQYRLYDTPITVFTKAFFILSAILFILSLIYIPLARRSEKLTRISASQAFTDTIIITFVVYISGGVASPLAFLYLLTIISSSIVAYQPGGIRAASLCTTFFGLLAFLEYRNILPAISVVLTGLPDELPSESIIYRAVSNISAFYLVALLSGYLARQAMEAEEKLYEKQVNYQALEKLNNDIVKNISSGLMTINEKGLVSSFNAAAESITGKRLEEVYMRPAELIFPFLAKTNRNTRMEDWYKRPDGKVFFLGFSMSPLKNAESEYEGTIVIFQDLTQFKEMEKALKSADRLAAVGRFAAGLAHEIRNPLASISGSVEILGKSLKDSATDKDRKLMDIVLRETDWLNGLITEFLSYARPATPQKTDFDLCGLAAEVIESMKQSAEIQNKEISFSFNGSSKTFFSADRSQIRQVLWNLIKNAAEAAPEKGRVKVEIERQKDPERILLSITDNGSGIPENMKEDIISPFNTTKPKGTGLGLPIVHNIVDSHRGHLFFESSPGETRFTVSFPEPCD